MSNIDTVLFDFDGTVMNTNDVVRMVTATGGGYGDPFKRPAEKVAMDAKNEYITVAQAES